MDQATFAAGCFWGVEDAFRRIDGVVATTAGYTGGAAPKPCYEEVAGGGTGHVEAVRLEFDPEIISYEDLLEIYWGIHDPTQEDGQGEDRGSQYRAVIFTHSEDQDRAAHASRRRLEAAGRHAGPIRTEIRAAASFYRAEEHHQRYYEKRFG